MSRTRTPWRMGFVLAVAFAAVAAAQPEVAPAPRLVVTPHVTDVPKELREKAKLDTFYKKHVDLEGLPILFRKGCR